MRSPLFKTEPLAIGHGVDPGHRRNDSFLVIIGVHQLCQLVFFKKACLKVQTIQDLLTPWETPPKTPLTLSKNTHFLL